MSNNTGSARRAAGRGNQSPTSTPAYDARASIGARETKLTRGLPATARPHVRRATATAHVDSQAGPVAASRASTAASSVAHIARTTSGDRVPTFAPPPWLTHLTPDWVLLPLRLFLGVTFLYAGIQKLTDPVFFKPAARGYIGNQIVAFAHGSPIGGLLLHLVAPHAVFFGALIAYGEIAIGLGTLIGLLARPAAFFGGLLSLVFFLSASWRVYPYFYGADIVFVFAWITLGLRPHAGLPNLDERAVAWLRQHWNASPSLRAGVCFWLFSVPDGPTYVSAERVEAPTSAAAFPVAGSGRTRKRQVARTLAARQQSRRTFLTGLGAGVAGTVGLVWLWNALHPAPASLPGVAGTDPSATATAGVSGATGQSTSAAGGTLIARVADVPANSAATFIIPSNQDPGVVVHLADGRFVAYDATCTHAGCPVQYDPGSKELYCPCHGAVFDPANGGAPLQGPTNIPLAPVQVQVDAAGNITLAS